VRLSSRLTAGLILAGAGLAAAQSPLASSSTLILQPAAGEAIYQQRCEICHGTEGDGSGPAAANMDPRPRDFRRGWYKVRSTTTGQLPTDADLVQIIAEGMPGTTMPAWGAILTPEELQAVADYIKGFSRRFERETPEPAPVVPAPGSSEERIGRGAQLFSGAGAECAKCHGLAGRGDGSSAGELMDDFGQPIVPADLSAPWYFRGGPSAEDIYLRLKTGLTGSPMPSYADVLSDEELWDLAYYVDSLGEDQAPQLQPFILARMIEGPLPTTAEDPIWQQAEASYYPLIGQLMREPRNFNSRIQAIWVQALHNASELALRLEWNDRFADQGQSSDSLAIEFPAELFENDERPYFVFGEAGKPVNLWVWDAGHDTIEEQSSEGAGSRVAQPTQDLTGRVAYAAGQYTLVVARSLATSDVADLQIPQGEFVPIAFAAWDGGSGEQAESGAIGSWQVIYLEQPAPLVSYAWVPAAVLAATALEWWAARRVRDSAPKLG